MLMTLGRMALTAVFFRRRLGLVKGFVLAGAQSN